MSVETLTGNGTWTCPAGVTEVQVECFAKGGAGVVANPFLNCGGGGGGGGAYSIETALAVTPGNNYDYNCDNSGGCWFSSAATVFAQSGQDASENSGGNGGAAASGVGDTTYSGGDGSDIVAFSSAGGGGGGEGASAAGNGNAGSGQTGGTGTAGADGGDGGNSGNSGQNGDDHGGGGGGAGTSGASGGTGGIGKIILTYTASPAGGGGGGAPPPPPPPDVTVVTPQVIVTGNVTTIIGGCNCCKGGSGSGSGSGGGSGGGGEGGPCCGCPRVPLRYQLSVGAITNVGPCGGAGNNCNALNGTWILELQGNECRWAVPALTMCSILAPSGTCFGGTGAAWALGCAADVTVPGAPLTFFLNTQIGGPGGNGFFSSWKKLASEWNCLGENTLNLWTFNGCCGNWPQSLTVIPV